jgi:hypothetical protein
MNRFIYIAVISLLMSCTPQRRFTRLIEKHPHLLTTDTLYVHDTVEVTVPEVSVDTIVEMHELHDTIFLEKEQLKVKVYIDREKKVYIEGRCDTVTVQEIIERKIPIKYYEKTPTWKRVLNWFILIIVIIAILYISFRIYKFVKKKT